MENAAYWRGRFTILEEAAHRRADRCTHKLERIYWGAEEETIREIESWYARFAGDNGLSLQEARRLLNTRELREFRLTVEEYIEAAQKYAEDSEWQRRLRNVYAKQQVSRLESIQVGIQQKAELLFGNQTDEIDTMLRRVASDGYLHTAYEVQKGLGIGWDFTALNQERLDRLLDTPWTADKRTFRDRCWEGKAGLVSGVQTDLMQSMLRGESIQKTTERIRKRFEVSRYKAGRLARTETTYFNAVATRESFKALGVEKYEIIGTLDRRTCEICGGMDGMVLPLSQYEPGVTVPPFHPLCRCTTAPAIEGLEQFLDEDGGRAARDDEGKRYYVPAGMKYKEWKEAFAGGGSKAGMKILQVWTENIVESLLKNAVGQSIIEVEKVTITGTPNSITQRVNAKGGIDRNYYDSEGRQSKQISNNDHGHKKESKFGNHGEHAHDYYFVNGALKHGPARELTEIERKENSDIL